MLFSPLIFGPYKRISQVFKQIILIVLPKMYPKCTKQFHICWYIMLVGALHLDLNSMAG